MLLLEEVIRQYIILSDTPAPSGWFTCKCAVCNDHKVRGGFHFENESVAYNCFNCGATGVYILGSETFSKKLANILEAFNVPEDAYKRTFFDGLQRKQDGTVQVQKRIDTGPQAICLPNFFYRLSEAADNNQWGNVAKQYLEDRLIDWTLYPFYLSRPGKDLLQKIWHKRLIIPFYRRDSLIFYQGRDLSGKSTRKYMSCASEMGKVVYGFDEIERHSTDPLFVVEGFFDAFLVNGAAVLHNTMSPQQINYLNMCTRTKVVIPDNRGEGWKLAQQGIEQGWSVSIPDIGNCKDVSEGMHKYGRLFVLNSIHQSILSNAQASVRVAIIKGSEDDKKRSPKEDKKAHQQHM